MVWHVEEFRKTCVCVLRTVGVLRNDKVLTLGNTTGYTHADYAESLAEFGVPRQLPRSSGWVLQRQIPDSPHHDAMGCYPLFVCPTWSQLYADLQDLGDELVSLSLVTDPFGDYDTAYLRKCFGDVMIPFKEHFVVDLSLRLDSRVSSHHHRNAKKAFENVQVECCLNPEQFLDEWVCLYTTLVKRHNIKGISAFSSGAFRKQLSTPGLVAFRAIHRETTVGMLLWYIQSEVGYYHLGAFSPTGYELRAAFALFWFALEHFAASGLRWLNLGAGAGVASDSADGLSRFKRGWATGTRTAYFCGRIFDQARYWEVSRARGILNSSYFPSYRAAEFEVSYHRRS